MTWRPASIARHPVRWTREWWRQCKPTTPLPRWGLDRAGRVHRIENVNHYDGRREHFGTHHSLRERWEAVCDDVPPGRLVLDAKRAWWRVEGQRGLCPWCVEGISGPPERNRHRRGRVAGSGLRLADRPRPGEQGRAGRAGGGAAADLAGALDYDEGDALCAF